MLVLLFASLPGTMLFPANSIFCSRATELVQVCSQLTSDFDERNAHSFHQTKRRTQAPTDGSSPRAAAVPARGWEEDGDGSPRRRQRGGRRWRARNRQGEQVWGLRGHEFG
uniref:Secreted protein n=1 Tax=Arundo donax TaxID=35708 RepID=A0A0A9GCR9_ARUDO